MTAQIERTTSVRIGEGRRMLVHVRPDQGAVGLQHAYDSADGYGLRLGDAVTFPFEQVGDVCAVLARVYDAVQAGELPRTRAAALAAKGVPEGATPAVTPRGLAAYAKPRKGATPPPSGKPPRCPSCKGPLDADRRCGLCDLGGGR